MIPNSEFRINAMDVLQMKRVIEGLLFISPQPVPLKRLKELFEEASTQGLRALITQLNGEYQATQRAFVIQEVAGGYQFVTDPALAPILQRAADVPRKESVSKAAMEVLAIIAYRQPITKAEIETIRGVDATATLETLLEHRFAAVVGRKDTPGRPMLYGTTTEFLRHFGLKNLEDLPPALPEPASEPAAEAAAAMSAPASMDAPVSSDDPAATAPAH